MLYSILYEQDKVYIFDDARLIKISQSKWIEEAHNLQRLAKKHS